MHLESDRKGGRFFTMQDDLNIIRKFCSVGWHERNPRGRAAWLPIPDEGALMAQRVLLERDGLTRRELAYGR